MNYFTKAILLGLLVLSVQQVNAQFYVQNNTNEATWVALAYTYAPPSTNPSDMNYTWVTEGWFLVQPGQKGQLTTHLNGSLQYGTITNVYYYAYQESGKQWRGNRMLFVDTNPDKRPFRFEEAHSSTRYGNTPNLEKALFKAGTNTREATHTVYLSNTDDLSYSGVEFGDPIFGEKFTYEDFGEPVIAPGGESYTDTPTQYNNGVQEQTVSDRNFNYTQETAPVIERGLSQQQQQQQYYAPPQEMSNQTGLHFGQAKPQQQVIPQSHSNNQQPKLGVSKTYYLAPKVIKETKYYDPCKGNSKQSCPAQAAPAYQQQQRYQQQPTNNTPYRQPSGMTPSGNLYNNVPANKVNYQQGANQQQNSFPSGPSCAKGSCVENTLISIYEEF